MARRRLNTILATTTLAAGLSVAPAWGQSLGDVTDAVESTVEDTTEAVETTTTTVEETVEETAETVEDTLSGDTDDGDTTTEDTDDAPLEVDLEVDVAPEDEDGSPQLEVDGGVTVGDQTLDVGSVTEPIENALDADQDNRDPGTDDGDGPDGHQTDTSSDSRDGGDSSWANGPGGFLEGGAVTAAGGAPRPADAPGSDSNGGNQSGRTVGESFAAYAAGNRGSDWSSGGTSSPGSTANSSEIAPPQVAGPADPSFEQFPASQVEEPTVLATPAATGDPTSPMAGMLKSIAALMVLGTGLAFKRSLDEA